MFCGTVSDPTCSRGPAWLRRPLTLFAWNYWKQEQESSSWKQKSVCICLRDTLISGFSQSVWQSLNICVVSLGLHQLCRKATTGNRMNTHIFYTRAARLTCHRGRVRVLWNIACVFRPFSPAFSWLWDPATGFIWDDDIFYLTTAMRSSVFYFKFRFLWLSWIIQVNDQTIRNWVKQAAGSQLLIEETSRIDCIQRKRHLDKFAWWFNGIV